MGNVDQSFKINEHITLKRGLTITEDVVHIPLINQSISPTLNYVIENTPFQLE
jgi:hypothetical protein